MAQGAHLIDPVLAVGDGTYGEDGHISCAPRSHPIHSPKPSLLLAWAGCRSSSPSKTSSARAGTSRSMVLHFTISTGFPRRAPASANSSSMKDSILVHATMLMTGPRPTAIATGMLFIPAPSSGYVDSDVLRSTHMIPVVFSSWIITRYMPLFRPKRGFSGSLVMTFGRVMYGPAIHRVPLHYGQLL